MIPPLQTVRPACCAARDGGDFVVVSMGRADIREVPPRSFQIIVDPRQSRLLQFGEVWFLQKPERAAECNVGFLLDCFQAFADPVHFLAGQRPARGHDGITQHAALFVVFRLLDDRFRSDERVSIHLRAVIAGLGAELAVFRAFTALAVDDCADVKHISAEMRAHLVGGCAQFFERHFRQSHGFLLGEASAGVKLVFDCFHCRHFRSPSFPRALF